MTWPIRYPICVLDFHSQPNEKWLISNDTFQHFVVVPITYLLYNVCHTIVLLPKEGNIRMSNICLQLLFSEQNTQASIRVVLGPRAVWFECIQLLMWESPPKHLYNTIDSIFVGRYDIGIYAQPFMSSWITCASFVMLTFDCFFVAAARVSSFGSAVAFVHVLYFIIHLFRVHSPPNHFDAGTLRILILPVRIVSVLSFTVYRLKQAYTILFHIVAATIKKHKQ